MSNIFPIDFEEKNTIANNDFILFSDSEDGNKLKKAQYSNLKGEQGDPGTPGAAATITVGSTTTGAAGTSASVTNSGTSSAAVFNFTIPQGAKGEPGEDGDDGAAATITVGTTTTLPAGSSATVTNSGTSSAAVLNFGIPKGDSGTGSGDVSGPASSTDGDVAIFDGATGKLIKDGSVALSTLSSAASLASTAIQPGDDISDLNNDSGFITGITSLDVTTALGYTPYNSSNPDGYTTNTGDVVGPGSSTDGHLAVFDGATGKLIKDGGAIPTGVPSVGTEGQVLTVVSGVAAWAAPSGGSSTITVTLASANWSSQSITVSATGVTASNTVIVSPAPSNINDYATNSVYCSAQGSGTLTFSCNTEPTVDIDVNVLIMG